MKASDLIIKDLGGYSGNEVSLIKRGGSYLVRKAGDVNLNYVKSQELKSKGFNTPLIERVSVDTIEMEYIQGLSIKDFLKIYDPNILSNFLINFFDTCFQDSRLRDYSEVIEIKLDSFDFFNLLRFKKQQILDKIPKMYPRSFYHGDLTLENIIFSNGKFYLIDGSISRFNSWVFDLAKLRQDLHCRWFLRNESNIGLYTNVEIVNRKIEQKYGQFYNDYLLVFMLMRVLAYAIRKDDKPSIDFLIANINSLWK